MSDRRLVSKSAFASLCGVNPSQVTRWIERSLIGGAALVGSGRLAFVDVAIAQEQLRTRRDAGQAMANGAKTILADEPAKVQGPPAPAKIRALQKGGPKFAELEPAPKPKEGSEFNYAREKSLLAQEQAEAQRIKNAQARGELVSIAEVEARWSDILAKARTRLLTVPARVRDAAPHLTSTDVLKIDAEIRKALTDLGRADAV